MLLKYPSTRGLCVHLQIFWFVDMFPKNIKKWTYPEWGIDGPSIPWPFEIFIIQTTKPAPPSCSVASDLEEVCGSRGQGEKAWKQELVSRLVDRALGPGPFSSGSARGRKFRQCLPLMAVLKMAVYVVDPPAPTLRLKTFHPCSSCLLWFLAGWSLFVFQIIIAPLNTEILIVAHSLTVQNM